MAPPEAPKDAKQERKAKEKQTKQTAPDSAAPKQPRSGAPLNFWRRLLGVLLCIVLFALLLASSLIYDFRDYSTEDRLYDLLRNVKASSVMATDLNPFAEANLRFSQRIVDVLDVYLGDRLSITSRDMETFLDKSDFKAFFAERIAALLQDIDTGKSAVEFDRTDIVDLLKENADFLKSELDLVLDRGLRSEIAQALEDAGMLYYFRTDTIRQDLPEVYYGLRIGCSWVTFGILVLLALVFIWLLAKALKSFRRAMEGTGIVLIVLGLLRAVPALLAKLFPGFWETILGGNYLLSAATGEILFGHLLIPSVVLLGLGVLLTVICALIRSVRNKRAAATEAS